MRFVMPGIAVIFAGRVAGQLLVTFGIAGPLPPVEEWQSGLLPYPILLASQIAILALMIGVARGWGPLVRPRPRVSVWTRRFSYLYFGGMIARYLITMVLAPEMRWHHGSIPIAMHLGLAIYLYAFARVIAPPAGSRSSATSSASVSGVPTLPGKTMYALPGARDSAPSRHTGTPGRT